MRPSFAQEEDFRYNQLQTFETTSERLVNLISDQALQIVPSPATVICVFLVFVKPSSSHYILRAFSVLVGVISHGVRALEIALIQLDAVGRTDFTPLQRAETVRHSRPDCKYMLTVLSIYPLKCIRGIVILCYSNYIVKIVEHALHPIPSGQCLTPYNTNDSGPRNASETVENGPRIKPITCGS